MSIKFDIQAFSGGGSDWSAGVTESAVNAALEEFDTKMKKAKETLDNYAEVDAAIRKGWEGTDCEQFLVRYHEHITRVEAEMDIYSANVHAEAEKIIAEWTAFQAGHIS